VTEFRGVFWVYNFDATLEFRLTSFLFWCFSSRLFWCIVWVDIAKSWAKRWWPACCWSKRCLWWVLNFGLCASLSVDFFLLSSSCFFFLSPVPDEGRPQELKMVTLEALGASGRAADGGEKGRPRRRGNPRRRSARACEIGIYAVFSLHLHHSAT
jgi:hypothetical protein